MKLTDLSIRKLRPPEKGQRAHFDDVLPNFGIRCGHTGTRSFIVMLGRSRRMRTIGRYPEMSLAEARKAAKKILADANALDNPSRRLLGLNFERAKRLYLEDCHTRLRTSTYEAYVRYLRLFAFEKPLTEVTRGDVMGILTPLRRTPEAQNFAFVTIRAFFNWCVRNELCERTPIFGARIPNKSKARERVLDDDEIAALWATTDDYPFGQIARALLLTGQRRTEISRLRWDQITDTITFTETKNDETHIIPVGVRMRSLLDALPANETYVFGSNFSGWSKSKRRLDGMLDIAPWTLHDLRRTFATRMAQLGTPIHVTERLLNHKSGTISGVAAIYNRHSYIEEMREAIAAYEDHLVKLTGE